MAGFSDMSGIGHREPPSGVCVGKCRGRVRLLPPVRHIYFLEFHSQLNSLQGYEKVLPVQCRMARAALGLGVRKLAAAAKMSPDTVVRFERGERLRERTIASLRQVLEAAGVEFTNGKRPGVRMRAR
jgi:hypothetical protein